MGAINTAVCFNCDIVDIEMLISNNTYLYCNEETSPRFKRKQEKSLKLGGDEHQKKRSKKA
jgi:hypothetical protein